MQPKQPRSLELFERFRPKFRRIKWMNRGLGYLRSGSDVVEPSIFSNKLWLMPMDSGSSCELPGIINGMPSLDLTKARVQFSKNFDSKAGLGTQFNEALFAAVWKEYFKGREFYIDPVLIGKPFATCLRDYDQTYLHITVEGGEIPGLDLAPAMSTYNEGWKTYIPVTAERKLIETALELEAAQYEHEKSEPYKRVRKLEDSLKSQFITTGL